MLLSELIENIDITGMSKGINQKAKITGICYNSSVAIQGELFVAIKGLINDGHDFIEDAIKKGVSCVICEVPPKTQCQYITVTDTRVALALVSAAWFGNPAKKMKFIGVTGTNGKTSCTYLIKHIIEKCCNSKVGLIGTIGNIIGEREIAASLTTPDSYELQSILAKMALEGCLYVVMEVSSHALYLSRVYGIDFEIGIFTNLSPEHLDFHKNMEEYARVKATLFNKCKHSVINIDDKYSNLMIQNSTGTVTTYGVENAQAELIANEVKLYPDKVEFYAVSEAKRNFIKVHLPGLFTVYNSLAVMAAMLKLGFDEESIADSLSTCQGIKGRAEVLKTGCDFTIIVDYAHTPDALRNIISAARTQTTNKVITLFGCGGDRDKSKRPVMGKISTEMSELTIITSDNPRTEDPQSIINDILEGIEDKHDGITSEKYIVISDRKIAICTAIDILRTGDVLIIAGKGHETYQIHGKNKIHFDDREIADQHLLSIRKSKRNQRMKG